MIVEMQAIIKGQVQGVGFRATTLKIAKELGITGFVKNVAHGNVEICAQGSQESLEKLLYTLQIKIFSKNINSIEVQYLTPSQEFTQFTITH